MFSLIITIISIALVAALALATLYYGGTAFNKGSAEATASRIINEGQQINGAVQMARADAANGTLAAPVGTLGGLVTAHYLQQLPASFAGDTAKAIPSDGTSGFVVTEAKVADDVCKKVNAKAGLGETIKATGDSTKAFSCFGTVAGENTVQYVF